MMTISLEKLPPKGLMLLYCKDGTVFAPYEVKDGQLISNAKLPDETARECHFFDEESEYRLITRESDDSHIEIVYSADEEMNMDPDLIYKEYPLIREEYSRNDGIPKKILIVSRYRYNENDVLELKNYRIGLPKSNS